MYQTRDSKNLSFIKILKWNKNQEKILIYTFVSLRILIYTLYHYGFMNGYKLEYLLYDKRKKIMKRKNLTRWRLDLLSDW